GNSHRFTFFPERTPRSCEVRFLVPEQRPAAGRCERGSAFHLPGSPGEHCSNCGAESTSHTDNGPPGGELVAGQPSRFPPETQPTSARDQTPVLPAAPTSSPDRLEPHSLVPRPGGKHC